MSSYGRNFEFRFIINTCWHLAGYELYCGGVTGQWCVESLKTGDDRLKHDLPEHWHVICYG